MDTRGRLLRALPRPALLRLAKLYEVPQGFGFVPTPQLVRALEACEALDPLEVLHLVRREELAAVATAFGVAPSRRQQLVPRLTSVLRWRPFDAAREFAHGLGLTGARAWYAWARSRHAPPDLPTDPDRVYRARGWRGWGDFLGTGSKGPHGYQYRAFSAARAFVHKLGLESCTQWEAWCRGERPDLPARPEDVPTNPHRTYCEEWRGMGDWLGTGTVATRRRVFLPFDEARRLVHSMRFRTQGDYYAWRRGRQPDREPPPPGMPGHPQTVYASRWFGWGDFLGNGRIGTTVARATFLPFRKARAFARSLGLGSHAEWHLWTKGALLAMPKRPAGIPTNPDKVYAGRGWVCMGDWLGAPLRRHIRSRRG